MPVLTLPHRNPAITQPLLPAIPFAATDFIDFTFAQPPQAAPRADAPESESHREYITGEIPAWDVLIVDDDPVLRRSIAETLQDAGYRVIGARDGVDALRVLDRASPWLILLDIFLPVMNGPDFVCELRQRGIDIRILVITAAEDPGGWAERVAATDYLSKPFEMDDMLSAVARHAPDTAGN